MRKRDDHPLAEASKLTLELLAELLGALPRLRSAQSDIHFYGRAGLDREVKAHSELCS
ncbi:hypothetical protein D9M68_647290 [compost metagenome]